MHREIEATREAPSGGWSVISQLDAREGQAGPSGVTEGSGVLRRPGNAGGGKGPWFKTTSEAAKDKEIGPWSWNLRKAFGSFCLTLFHLLVRLDLIFAGRCAVTVKGRRRSPAQR
jgi:hypothetical protein